METNHSRLEAAISQLSHYLHGKEKALRLAFTCFFARGHLLIEDSPGLGKTTLAIAIAKILGLTFGRVQCTSDLLPTDITGLSIFNKEVNAFEFRPGPIFNHIVLVDEINRASPKTQSALLEAMGEKQVTIEGQTYDLPQPFFVIATQNPSESYGTFPLPESQLDRFLMRIQICYPERDAEREILKGGSKRRELYQLDAIMGVDEILQIQDLIRHGIFVSDRILEYVLNVIEATRKNHYFSTGLSTRGALALINAAKAHAYFSGKDFLIPENIKKVAEFVIPHRMPARDEYESVNKREILRSLLADIPIPV